LKKRRPGKGHARIRRLWRIIVVRGGQQINVTLADEPKRPRQPKPVRGRRLENDAPRPLPDRLRPRTLSDVVAKTYLGPDGALTRMLATRTLDR